MPGAWHTDAVLGIVHESERFEAADEAVRAEIAAWTRTGAAGEGSETEGIPSYAFGPRQYDVTSPVPGAAPGPAAGHPRRSVHLPHPLEWSELRSVVRDPESTTGFVHMIIRLGYDPQGRATPRRPASEVLTFD